MKFRYHVNKIIMNFLNKSLDCFDKPLEIVTVIVPPLTLTSQSRGIPTSLRNLLGSI